MSTDTLDENSTVISKMTAEEKLQHEVKFLQERVTNLEVFKKNFFMQHHELIEAREKISLLEGQINLEKVRESIVGSDNEPAFPVKEGNILLDYFHNCLTANSFQDLTMSLFQSVEDIASNISLIIHDPDLDLNFSSNNSTTEENLVLIRKNLNSEDITQIKEKTLLNYKHISLIYTVVDSDGPERTKQHHDFMEIITLGANSRISHIKQFNELEQLRRNIYQIFKRTNKSFKSMQNSIDENTLKVSNIYEDCRTSVLTHIEKIKMEPRHVTMIKLILDESRTQLLLELTSAMSLDKDFLDVMKRLENAYAKEYAK